MSWRKSCCYPWISIPAEPAPVCTFLSLWASKGPHLACNKMLLYFPCKPSRLTLFGVCLLYGLKIWPLIWTQFSRYFSLPQLRLRSKQQISQVHFLSSYLWVPCVHRSIWSPWDIWVRTILYSVDTTMLCKLRNHLVWNINQIAASVLPLQK